MADDVIRDFYKGWDTYNQRVIDVIATLSAEQLELRSAPALWPLWATVGHTAGVRVYWLCGILGEPGVEDTPFPDAVKGIGWEDDPDTPRTAAELVLALETTWRIIDDCLGRWSAKMLEEVFQAPAPGGPRPHTRQSVLMRLLTHDAYHCGELSQSLGILGLTQIDLWGPGVETST